MSAPAYISISPIEYDTLKANAERVLQLEKRLLSVEAALKVKTGDKLTIAEAAELMGWTVGYMYQYRARRVAKGLSNPSKYTLTDIEKLKGKDAADIMIEKSRKRNF